ncbi:MAG TPA: hypothetical protein VJJ80_01440 [Patescibacteria group bacterium]|nr:hypothetical protein [Patescibacteria group bacterium]
MIILLLAYLAFLLGFIIISGLGLYHLWKYGFRGDMTKIVMITYIVVTGIIIFFSLAIMLSLKWGSVSFPSIEEFIPQIFRGG